MQKLEKLEKIEILKVDRINNKKLIDSVVVEVPLTVVLNGKEVITMLCTPDKMDYLALGFLKSEGLISNKSDIKEIKVDQEEGKVEVETNTATSSLIEELHGQRTITSGCGKGTIFYNVIDSLQCTKVESDLQIEVDNALQLVKDLQKRAELFKETGGSHSSALCTPQEIVIFNEDIGRHNAVDKIVGQVIMEELEWKDKLVVTSGRVSSEILLKVAKLGIPILISRAAPTSLTVKIADELGITLICFARGKRMNVYTHDYRVKR